MITLTREEVQQVLDIMESTHFAVADNVKHSVVMEHVAAIELLRARLAEPEKEQEPVAFGVLDDDGQIDWTIEYPFSNEPGWPDSAPLYTAPPQREPDEVTQAILLYKTVERLALQAGEEPDETIDWLCGEHSGMLKLFESYFLPKQSQREWVGLTDEEMNAVYRQAFGLVDSRLVGDQIKFVSAIEAKLKEKNHE